MIDSDADGIPDYRDLDSDNDGLTDAYEAGGSDENGDGVIDNFLDSNNDGHDDTVAAMPLPNEDFDGDSVLDFRDVDSDNDGLPDLAEADGFASDADNDGRVDDFTDSNGDGLDDAVAALPFDVDDIDEDGSPDHLDLDTDNGGIFDLVEAGGVDSDNDGIVDAFADTNQNGIPDTIDATLIGGSDADNDGVIDIADTDFVTGEDANGNGVVDAQSAAAHRRIPPL